MGRFTLVGPILSSDPIFLSIHPFTSFLFLNTSYYKTCFNHTFGLNIVRDHLIPGLSGFSGSLLADPGLLFEDPLLFSLGQLCGFAGLGS